MSRDKILSGPEFFDCEKLSARISARQCLLNQGKAHGMKIFWTRYIGRERFCLECPEGREMAAYPRGSVPEPKNQNPEPDKDHRLEACATEEKDHRLEACATGVGK